MVFPREAPRAVEVMTAAAAAASSSSPSPPPHRPVVLRGKPRSRLPLPALKPWANHRLLHQCVGDDGDPGNGGAAASATSSTPGSRRRPAGAGDDGFERIRAKLMDHLREAAGRIELPAMAPGEEKRKEPLTEVPAGDDVSHADVAAVSHADVVAVPQAAPAISVSVAATSPPAAPSASAEELPWNLRTRRSTPASNGRHHHHQNPEFEAPPPAAKPASRLRSGAPERREAALRRRRPRFSVPLTKEEIDEDMYAFTGRLASRRPKKRPRAVQKQLDMLFPGLWLSEVTVDMYQVADPPPPPPS